MRYLVMAGILTHLDKPKCILSITVNMPDDYNLLLDSADGKYNKLRKEFCNCAECECRDMKKELTDPDRISILAVSPIVNWSNIF